MKLETIGVLDMDAQLAPGGKGENIGKPGLAESFAVKALLGGNLSLFGAVGIGERNGAGSRPAVAD